MNHTQKAEARGASKSLTKRQSQLADTFDIAGDIKGNPGEKFDWTVEKIEELIREVASRAYGVGARHGAIAALDAVLDGKITYDNTTTTLWFMRPQKALELPEQEIGGKTPLTTEPISFKVGPISLTHKRLGFGD